MKKGRYLDSFILRDRRSNVLFIPSVLLVDFSLWDCNNVAVLKRFTIVGFISPKPDLQFCFMVSAL